MVVPVMCRHPPGHVRKTRLLIQPAVITALLVFLLISTAAVSKELPRSTSGGAGPLSNHPRGANTGRTSGGRSKSGGKRRPPTPISSVPTSKEGDKRPNSKRGAAAAATTTKRDASSKADGAGQRSTAPAAAAAVPAVRRPPQQHQQKHQQRPSPATRMSEEEEDENEDFDFDIDTDMDSFEDDGYDSVWSDEGGSDEWSDEDDDEDEDEDDWGRGVAGGPGGGGGRSSGRKPGRGKARGGGRGAIGGESGGAAMGMSGWRDRLNKARQRASSAYREAKSLMSSEMEGVVLKATRPDDMPVKPKHLEALMRPTAEMPKEFNVYLPVVRKLWSKMADREWRVSAKALYIVHRFAADGSIEHATNLKESVAVLRTHHDSRRKVNYFDMDTICDVKAPSWSGEDVAPMAEFLRGYADFVLRRTTQFGPDFRELLDTFAMLDGHGEMIIVVEGLMSAGSRCCQLCKEQEGAVTAAAALQVAQDVRDVMEVCAAQLEYLAKDLQAGSVYPSEVGRWYAFLYENRENVEALIDGANSLAEKHKLAALRPLVATPVVLEMRDEELALEKKAALEAEQQRCPSTDEKQETPDKRPLTDPTKTMRNTKGQLEEDSVGSGADAGGRPAVAGATGKRREQDARARSESVLPSGAAPPSGAAKSATRAPGAKDRAGTRPKSTSSPASADSSGAGPSARKRSVSSRAAGGVQRSAVRRPPESDAGEGARAAAASAADREGDARDGGSATQEVSRGAGAATSAADGKAKSRVAKKKRSSSTSSSSPTSSKSKGREETRSRPSAVKGGTKRETSLSGGRGSRSSSSSSSRSGSVRPQSSAPKTERQDKPSAGSSPRSG